MALGHWPTIAPASDSVIKAHLFSN